MITTTSSPWSSSLSSMRMTTMLFLLFSAVVSVVVMIAVPWLPFQQQQHASVYVSSFQLLPLQRHISPYHHYDNNNKQQLLHRSCIFLLAVDATNNKELIVNSNDDDDDDGIAAMPVSIPVANNNKYNQQLWEQNFALLKQFYQREGHYNILVRHEEDGKKLGLWVGYQRRSQKKGELLTEREKKLNDLDGCDGDEFFDIDTQVWEDNFSTLVRYKQREGNCSVPKAHQEDKNYVGRWLRRQRSDKSTGKLHGMREQRLLDLGVVLDNVTVHSNRWDDYFALLCEYQQTEGHCNVPRWYKGGDGMEKGTRKIFLGRWVGTQKTMKNGNKLDSARQQKLDGIGFLWAVPRTIFWDDYFLLLEEYKSREGHCMVSIDHKEDDIPFLYYYNCVRRITRVEILVKLMQLGPSLSDL